MKIENKSFDSFLDFFEAILPTGELSKKLRDSYIYRGESTTKYKLIPSVLRLENKDELWGPSKPIDNQSEWEHWQIHAEYRILRHFYKIANNNGLKVPFVKDIRDNYMNDFPSERMLLRGKYKWIPNQLVELTALAQHYGILTRLLDWTTDPFVALYFASIGAIKSALKNNGAFDDDKIVIWALNSQHIQFLQPSTNRIPLNFVVPSYYENPNLSAQKGVLSYWEIEMNSLFEESKKMMQNIPPKFVDRTPLDELIKRYCNNGVDDHIILLYKFEFPVQDCQLVKSTVSKLGYSAAKLFPGYYGVTRKMKEDSMTQDLSTKIKKNAIC